MYRREINVCINYTWKVISGLSSTAPGVPYNNVQKRAPQCKHLCTIGHWSLIFYAVIMRWALKVKLYNHKYRNHKSIHSIYRPFYWECSKSLGMLMRHHITTAELLFCYQQDLLYVSVMNKSCSVTSMV